MRSKMWVYFASALLCFFSLQSVAQQDRLSIGVDVGSGVIQASLISLAVQELETSGAMVPKHIRGRLEIPLGPNTLLRGSVGYGMTKEKQELEASYQSFSSEAEAEYELTGLPVEGAVIFHVPIDSKGLFNVRIGVAGGYYTYTFKASGFEQKMSGNQVFRDEFEIPDVSISGVAQSFIAGFAVNVTPSVKATFEIAKLGFSALKATQDIEATLFDDQGNAIGTQTIGESKSDVNASAGLTDLAISFGLSFAMGG